MDSQSLNKDRLGKAGEAVVRKWLVDQGYMILPASLINEGSAPMLRGKLKSIILPDTLAWKNGVQRWVEIKTKTTHTERLFSPDAGCLQHGLPERHWRNYCLIQDETKIPVSIAVLQVDRRMLFIGQLDSLKKSIRQESFRMMDGELHVWLNLLYPNKLSDFEDWYRLGDDYSLPDFIQPLAWRTLTQSPDPLIRQLTLDEFIDYLEQKREKMAEEKKAHCKRQGISNCEACRDRYTCSECLA